VRSRIDPLGAAAALLIYAWYFRQLAIRDDDPDVWGRLAMGRQIVEAGRIVPEPTFAYTPTWSTWVDHEWLTGVLFYSVHGAFGEAGLLVFKAALGLVVLTAVLATARLHGRVGVAPLLVAAVALPTIGYGFAPRAQTITYALVALWIFLLERFRVTGRRGSLWLVPPLAALWANCHGGFVVGLGLLCVYTLASDRRRPIAIALCASVLATLVNPYGPRLWTWILYATTMARTGISEWVPMPVDRSAAFFWILLAMTVVGVVRKALHAGAGNTASPSAGGGLADERRGVTHSSPSGGEGGARRAEGEDLKPALLWLAITALVALPTIRHMPFFGIAAAAFTPVLLVPRGWQPLANVTSRMDRAIKTGATALLLGMSALQIRAALVTDGPWRFAHGSFEAPDDTVEQARAAGLGGNIALPLEWGEYVIWTLYPRANVSFDGRFECYTEEAGALESRFLAGGPGWRDLLDQYPTKHVLVPLASPVVPMLDVDPEWSLRFSGPVSRWYSRVR
jgi:hypothetical protein